MPFPRRDVSGLKFGRLVIVGDAARRDKTKHRSVACRCDCGEETVVRLATLRSGRTKSCGCLHRENLATQHTLRESDLSGRKYGRLTVLNREPSRKLGKKWHAYWKCLCECGRETIVQRSSLTSHATQSCGCLHIERVSQSSSRHGKHGTPEYGVWGQIVQRCTNPKHPAFKNYGGRGIGICAEWRASFLAFIEDVGRRPAPGLELDRIDNDGWYEPGNVRWVTRAENNQNRSFVSREQAEALKRKIKEYEERFKAEKV